MSKDITVIELLKLFDKKRKENNWGEFASIELLSDGSGYILDNDDDIIFAFDNLDELLERLRK